MSRGPDDADDADDQPGGEDDPFEWVEEPVDREGDPFADLDPDAGRGADQDPDPDPDADAAPGAGGPRVEDLGPDREHAAETEQAGDPSNPGVAGDDADPADPFGEPDPRGDPFESGDLFQREGADEIDPDAVWERLARLESGEGVGAEESTYAEVSKHSYCEQCPHFSEPPDVECTHEEAEIVEFLDMETVRLLNCPVVAERQALREE